jgi:archaellum component FlaF (FlaF/FlaG flagellin family)
MTCRQGGPTEVNQRKLQLLHDGQIRADILTQQYLLPKSISVTISALSVWKAAHITNYSTSVNGLQGKSA